METRTAGPGITADRPDSRHEWLVRAPAILGLLLATAASVYGGILAREFVLGMLLPPVTAFAALLLPSRLSYAIATLTTGGIVVLGAMTIGFLYIPAFVPLLLGTLWPRKRTTANLAALVRRGGWPARVPGLLALFLASAASAWVLVGLDLLIIDLFVPPAAALVASLYGSRTAYAIAVAATAVIIGAGIESIGLFYTPALLVLAIGTAWARPRRAAARPTP